MIKSPQSKWDIAMAQQANQLRGSSYAASRPQGVIGIHTNPQTFGRMNASTHGGFSDNPINNQAEYGVRKRMENLMRQGLMGSKLGRAQFAKMNQKNRHFFGDDRAVSLWDQIHTKNRDWETKGAFSGATRAAIAAHKQKVDGMYQGITPGQMNTSQENYDYQKQLLSNFDKWFPKNHYTDYPLVNKFQENELTLNNPYDQWKSAWEAQNVKNTEILNDPRYKFQLYGNPVSPQRQQELIDRMNYLSQPNVYFAMGGSNNWGMPPVEGRG